MSRKPYKRPLLSSETLAAQQKRLAQELEDEKIAHAMRCGQACLSEKLPNYEERLGVTLSEADMTYLLLDWLSVQGIEPEYRNAVIEIVVESYLLRRSNGNEDSTEA